MLEHHKYPFGNIAQLNPRLFCHLVEIDFHGMILGDDSETDYSRLMEWLDDRPDTVLNILPWESSPIIKRGANGLLMCKDLNDVLLFKLEFAEFFVRYVDYNAV